ncbi:3-isopropylmalate dehydrogenase [Lactarius indigo]|nr:3-isopropylmalate dehydrogenase [Lactarius indigo]
MVAKTFRVVVLPGDGIGPEVVAEAVNVLKTVFAGSSDVELKLETHLFGGCAIDETGEALPASTLQACKEADAILMGSIGGPKWGVNSKVRPEAGLLALPQGPWGESITKGVDIIVIRELIGGIYFGERKEQNVAPDENVAWDTMIYSVEEVQRITRVAAQIALASDPPLPIHSIDKANVLASSRLWRKVVTETLASEYPQIALDHQLVDSAAMILVSSPRKLNGVSFRRDKCHPGSLGLLPSASLAGAPSLPSSSSFKPTSGLYEPIHGSAPDIAGKGIANPIGTILSAAMLLRYSLGLEKQAQLIETAVRKALDARNAGGLELRTADLGGNVGTKEIGSKIVEILKTLL